MTITAIRPVTLVRVVRPSGLGHGPWRAAERSKNGEAVDYNELQAQIDARDNNALTANVLYGVGLVGLGTGVVLWLMAPDDARAVPSVGLTPDGGVFLWSGSF